MRNCNLLQNSSPHHRLRLLSNRSIMSLFTTSAPAAAKSSASIPPPPNDPPPAALAGIRELFMTNKAAAASPSFVVMGWELLDLTLLGHANDRTSELVKRLAVDIEDQSLKHHLFSTAIRNLSKAAQRESVDLFRAIIAKHTVLLPECLDIVESDAVRWSRGHLSELSGVPALPDRRVSGVSLNSHLDSEVRAIAATKKWYDNVDIARRNVYELLRPSIKTDIDIEFFGSCRSGLSSLISDCDMTCLMRGHVTDVGEDIPGYERDYIHYRTQLETLLRKLSAVEQLRVIIRHCIAASHRPLLEGSEEAVSLGNFHSWIDRRIEQCREERDQLEKEVRMAQIDRHSHCLIETARTTPTNTKKLVYTIGNALRSRYSNVNVIPHARVAVVKFRDPTHKLDIDLVINKRIAIHNSDLIKDYMAADSSGKVKKVALLVKSLVKVHQIGDASSGTMSSYSWVVLLLHTLLRHEYLPAFNPLGDTRDKMGGSHFCESYYVSYAVPNPLPSYFQDRLAAVSVAELLILFTGYLTSRVDVTADCLTMRGQGEVISKGSWRKKFIVRNCDPGFLSIEDPFERADSVCGHDLAQTIRSQKINDLIIAKMRAINLRLILAYSLPVEPLGGKKDFSKGLCGAFDEGEIMGEISQRGRKGGRGKEGGKKPAAKSGGDNLTGEGAGDDNESHSVEGGEVSANERDSEAPVKRVRVRARGRGRGGGGGAGSGRGPPREESGAPTEGPAGGQRVEGERDGPDRGGNAGDAARNPWSKRRGGRGRGRGAEGQSHNIFEAKPAG